VRSFFQIFQVCIRLEIDTTTVLFRYYGLWMWLPELYTRISVQGGAFCTAKYQNTSSVRTKPCDIDSSVYASSLVNALSSIPGNVLTIFFIDKIGRNLITGKFA
jgi:hypothetical protein